MKHVHLSLAVLCLAAGAAQADTNLLVNGSFETGDFSSWQTQLGDPTTFVDYGPPGRLTGDATDGRFLAFFGSTQASGGSFISQTFATAAGSRYVLAFDLADDNGGAAPNNAFSVSVAGAVRYSAVDLAGQNDVRQTVSFIAQGALSTVRLGGYNDIGYLELDAVSVTIAPVPEPATVALLLAGAGLLPLVSRSSSVRRR